MALAPHALSMLLHQATPTQRLPPRRQLHAEWVRGRCSKGDRGRRLPTRHPRRSSTPRSGIRSLPLPPICWKPSPITRAT